MNRYKDRDPKETVEYIKGILNEIGYHPEGEVMNFAGRFFSLRIEDADTKTGTNGKGASEDLALASAYGEYMERLQNDFLILAELKDEDLSAYGGFRFWPDEREVSFDEAIEEQPFIRKEMQANFVSGGVIKERSAVDLSEEARDFWRKKIGDTVAMIPYYCVGTDSCVDLPENIVRKIGMSNGLCSGNTPEEALVEGMSELCERYAKAIILNRELCPPRIPREYIERNCPMQAEMLRIIEEKSPELNIVVMDGSLGQGIPTVCMLFIDRNAHSIRPKFGSHPSMAIALERCMTEQYQGYIEQDESILSNIFIPWEPWSRKAVHFHALACSAFTSDRYAVPDRMLLDVPDWKFEPWGMYEDFDNKKGLTMLTNILREIGGEVYIRDSGYLGMPAYRVFVPIVAGIPTPGGDGAARAEKYGVNVGCAMVAYELGDYELAADFLKMTKERKNLCAAQELLCRKEGIPADDRDILLETYYGSGPAAYAKAVWRSDDVEKALDGYRRRLNLLKIHGEGGIKKDPAKEALKKKRIEQAYKLKERKRANPIDQMRLSELYR